MRPENKKIPSILNKRHYKKWGSGMSSSGSTQDKVYGYQNVFDASDPEDMPYEFQYGNHGGGKPVLICSVKPP